MGNNKVIEIKSLSLSLSPSLSLSLSLSPPRFKGRVKPPGL